MLKTKKTARKYYNPDITMSANMHGLLKLVYKPSVSNDRQKWFLSNGLCFKVNNKLADHTLFAVTKAGEKHLSILIKTMGTDCNCLECRLGRRGCVKTRFKELLMYSTAGESIRIITNV